MPDINAQQIIFARRLERQLHEVKTHKAKELIDATIDSLYSDATNEGSSVEWAYQALQNKHTSKGDKDAANRAIIQNIAEKKQLAIYKHKIALDRVVLGNDDYDASASPFANFWQRLGLSTQPQHPIRHHVDVLNAIKSHFEYLETNNTQTPEALHQAYHEARAQYYAMLEVVYKHNFDTKQEQYQQRILSERNLEEQLRYKKLKDEHKRNAAWVDTKDEKLSYQLGYEKKRIENDIANKQTDQTLLKWGLRVAKGFALAQGVFVAGGTFLLFSALLPMLGIPPGLPLAIMKVIGGVISGVLFLATTRSNWLTINEEMGPLLKILFFDPALAHLSYWKRTKIWLRRSELSTKSTINTAKGFTNLIAGAFLGVLTLMGGMGMLGVIPALPLIGTFGLGVFGAASLIVIGSLMLLSAVTTFVYFVINNINQKDKNEGGTQAAKELERHEKMRTIAHTSKFSFLKHYGVNIVIGMIGVGFTLSAASTDIFLMMAPGLAGLNTGTFFSFLGTAALNSIPLAGILTALIVGIAWYGISSFYQARTRNATERLIGLDKGLVFDELKGSTLDNMDVTGEKAPDFGHQERMNARNPVRKLIDFLTFPLFNMTVDNSERARRSNALGQGMPAFMGAWTLGTLALTFIFGVVAPPLVLLAPVIALPIGAIFGTVFASFASWSANSAGCRYVNDAITEINILNADKRILDAAHIENPHLAALGGDKADAELYIASRSRQQANFYGFGKLSTYQKGDKVDAANRLIKNIDDFVENQGVKIQSSDKTSMLNFLYVRPDMDKKRGFNPLVDKGSDLGSVAEHAADHIISARRAKSA